MPGIGQPRWKAVFGKKSMKSTRTTFVPKTPQPASATTTNTQSTMAKAHLGYWRAITNVTNGCIRDSKLLDIIPHSSKLHQVPQLTSFITASRVSGCSKETLFSLKVVLRVTCFSGLPHPVVMVTALLTKQPTKLHASTLSIAI